MDNCHPGCSFDPEAKNSGLQWAFQVLQANSQTSSKKRLTCPIEQKQIPSLKRTSKATKNQRLLQRNLLLGGLEAYFQGRSVSFREGMHHMCNKILPTLQGLFDVLLESVKSSLPWALWQLLIPTTSTLPRMEKTYLGTNNRDVGVADAFSYTHLSIHISFCIRWYHWFYHDRYYHYYSYCRSYIFFHRCTHVDLATLSVRSLETRPSKQKVGTLPCTATITCRHAWSCWSHQSGSNKKRGHFGKGEHLYNDTRTKQQTHQSSKQLPAFTAVSPSLSCNQHIAFS